VPARRYEKAGRTVSDPDILDAELERLRGATAAIEPSPGFAARASARASARREPDGWGSIVQVGRFLIPVAALAAVATLVVAVRSEHDYDEAVAMAWDDDDTELRW